MSQKKQFFGKSKQTTSISPDLTNSPQDIPCKSKENNSPCSEDILNEEFQSSQLILLRQQSSLNNFDFNVGLQPGSSPLPASLPPTPAPTPPVPSPLGSPQSPNSQQLPGPPKSTDSTSTRLTTTTSVQLSPVSSSTSEPPDEVFSMVLHQPLAANACRNKKSLSPNQPVIFKNPKRGYKDSNRSFQPHWYKRWKSLHYNEQKDRVTCYVCWHAHLHHILPNMKTDGAFIESGYTNQKKDTKKGFNQHEKSAVHRSAVNLVQLNETKKSFNQHEKSAVHHSAVNLIQLKILLGQQQKNLLEIQQKNLAALMTILSSICHLARQILLLGSHNDSESNFRQLLLLRAEDDPNFHEWLQRNKPIYFTSHSKWNFKRYGNAYSQTNSKKYQRNSLL